VALHMPIQHASTTRAQREAETETDQFSINQNRPMVIFLKDQFSVFQILVSFGFKNIFFPMNFFRESFLPYETTSSHTHFVKFYMAHQNINFD
jgi:hypothetical protein